MSREYSAAVAVGPACFGVVFARIPVVAEARVPGPPALVEPSPRVRVAVLLSRRALLGKPAQLQMTVAGVVMPEPPGDQHADPANDDRGGEDGAAHGPSPRRGRCRAGCGRPGDRSRPGMSRAEAD